MFLGLSFLAAQITTTVKEVEAGGGGSSIQPVLIGLTAAGAALIGAWIAASSAKSRQEEQLKHDTARQERQLAHDTERQTHELTHAARERDLDLLRELSAELIRQVESLQDKARVLSVELDDLADMKPHAADRVEQETAFVRALSGLRQAHTDLMLGLPQAEMMLGPKHVLCTTLEAIRVSIRELISTADEFVDTDAGPDQLVIREVSQEQAKAFWRGYLDSAPVILAFRNAVNKTVGFRLPDDAPTGDGP